MADMVKKDEVYFNVYKNESDNPAAPTHSFKNFKFQKDIVIKAGTVADITFWGNAVREGKPNPHLKIGVPYKSDTKAPF